MYGYQKPSNDEYTNSETIKTNLDEENILNNDLNYIFKYKIHKYKAR